MVSLKVGVLCFCLGEHRNTGIGALPESKDVVVSGFCFCLFSRRCERPCPGQLPAGRGFNRVACIQSGMRQESAEFGARFLFPMHRQVRKAADVHGVHVAIKVIEGERRNAEFIAPVGLEQIDGFRRVVPGKGGQRTQRRNVG